MRECKLLMISENNNNKYYNMRIFKNSPSTIHIEYGRVGVTKQVGTYPSSKWDSIIRDKIKKGYKDVTHLFQVEDKECVKFADISDSVIANLLSTLQKYTKVNVSSHYNIGAESVTQKQVNEAQAIIDELTKLSTIDDINKVLLNLYTIIPRKMNNVKNHLLHSFDQTTFNGLVSKEQDLLDNMASQIKQVELEANNEDNTITLLDALGLQIFHTTKEEQDMVKSKMTDISNMYDASFSIVNKKTRKRFEDNFNSVNNKYCELMFHGTRNSCVFPIMEQGLLLRPSNCVISGKMFGFGSYFASSARKSLGYTDSRGSYWAKGNSNEAFMFLFDVHLGNQYTIQSSDSSLSKEKLISIGNYNSTWAKAGKGLINDEFIIYDENQSTVKYLIRLKG